MRTILSLKKTSIVCLKGTFQEITKKHLGVMSNDF